MSAIICYVKWLKTYLIKSLVFFRVHPISILYIKKYANETASIVVAFEAIVLSMWDIKRAASSPKQCRTKVYNNYRE